MTELVTGIDEHAVTAAQIEDLHGRVLIQTNAADAVEILAHPNVGVEKFPSAFMRLHDCRTQFAAAFLQSHEFRQLTNFQPLCFKDVVISHKNAYLGKFRGKIKMVAQPRCLLFNYTSHAVIPA